MTQIITIFGGTGFVGSKIIFKLANNSKYRIRLVTRDSKKISIFKVLPNVDIYLFDQLSKSNFKKAISGSHVVINLMGILHEDKINKFDIIHAQFPKLIQNLCIDLNVRKLIHFSALKSETRASQYLSSKNHAEINLLNRKGSLRTYVLKPSIIFGDGDNFINLFYKLIKIFPIFSIISYQSRFQPISVDDVTEIVKLLVKKNRFQTRSFDLGGEHDYSFYEIVDLIKKTKNINCILIKLPYFLNKIVVAMFGLMPVKIITKDNLKSLSIPNTCSVNHAYEFLTSLKSLKEHIIKL